MLEQIIVREIAWNSAEYRQELELRQEVLRKPLGMNLYEQDLSAEERYFHFAAFAGEIMLGVCMVSTEPDDCMQVRQVAVRETARGTGVGRQLIQFVETFCKKQGAIQLTLHARKTALGFYERLGYKVTGEPFTEIGLQHCPMAKIL